MTPDSCPACGGELIWGYVPDHRRYAYLRDYTRLALFCEECGAEVEP